MTEMRVAVLNDEYFVDVVWGTDKQITKIANDHGYFYNSDTMGRGMCLYKYGRHPMIILRSIPTTPDLISSLAHEAIHAVNHIFDYIGEESRDEVFAHCIGAIVRSILKRTMK